VDLTYDVPCFCDYYGEGITTVGFFGTSPVTGTFNLPYSWYACHSWFRAMAGAAYVVDSVQTAIVDYQPAGCGTTFTGSVDVTVKEGDQWGVILSASNFDSSRLQKGTFRFVKEEAFLPNVVVPSQPISVPSSNCTAIQGLDYSESVIGLIGGEVVKPSCTPPPGSDFPVGKTAVACEVTSSTDGTTTVSSPFEINVVGPAGQVSRLARSLPDEVKDVVDMSLFAVAEAGLLKSCPSEVACAALDELAMVDAIFEEIIAIFSAAGC